MIMIHNSEKLDVNSLNNYMCNIFICYKQVRLWMRPEATTLHSTCPVA